MYSILCWLGWVLFFCPDQPKTYVKNYFLNGKIASEGWICDNKKTDYWYFYRDNGLKKEEGHYANNLRNKWWIVYDVQEKIAAKSEYKADKLDGFTIIYQNGRPVRAEKYQMGVQLKRWTSLAEFKKDNSELK